MHAHAHTHTHTYTGQCSLLPSWPIYLYLVLEDVLDKFSHHSVWVGKDLCDQQPCSFTQWSHLLEWVTFQVGIL